MYGTNVRWNCLLPDRLLFFDHNTISFFYWIFLWCWLVYREERRRQQQLQSQLEQQNKMELQRQEQQILQSEELLRSQMVCMLSVLFVMGYRVFRFFLTIIISLKIVTCLQMLFTFLLLAYLGSPGQRAVKRVLLQMLFESGN